MLTIIPDAATWTFDHLHDHANQAIGNWSWVIEYRMNIAGVDLSPKEQGARSSAPQATPKCLGLDLVLCTFLSYQFHNAADFIGKHGFSGFRLFRHLVLVYGMRNGRSRNTVYRPNNTAMADGGGAPLLYLQNTFLSVY